MSGWVQSGYHEMSARRISKDIALRKRKLIEERQLRRRAKRKKQEKPVEAEPVITKRKVKRDVERQNKMWRNFDRRGYDGASGNEAFTSFYKQQLSPILTEPNDWDAFTKSLSQDLPVTFRVNGRNKVVCESVKHALKGELQMKGVFVKVDDKVVSGRVLQPLEWFGAGDTLWQVNASRTGFGKAKALAPLYDTVSRMAQLGHVARQECASMLPALALNIKSGQCVLDMCASPGSKTEQVLELMREAGGDGLLVANDADPKRIQHMKRRFFKFGDPKLLMTCCRGERFFHTINKSAGGDVTEVFDRIICDVPCSGDGTIRKMPYLWRRWRANRGVLLHPLQADLLKNAAAVLKVNGRLVYSTCSFNPFENEAVVLELLRTSKGALKLVPSGLPSSLKRRQGLETWSLDSEFLNSDEKKSPKIRAAYTESMSPPTKAEIKKFNLKLCERLLPHDNDTGGFFIAVLEKVKSWSGETKDSSDTRVNALGALRDAGYAVDQSTKGLSVLTLRKPSEVTEREIRKHFKLKTSNACLSVEAEAQDELRVVSTLLSESLYTWGSKLPVLSAGLRIGHLRSGAFVPDEYGVGAITDMISSFQVSLGEVTNVLDMVHELFTSLPEEEQSVVFELSWLNALLEAQSPEVSERINGIEDGSVFRLTATMSLSKHQNTSEPVMQGKRKLSKRERKLLKRKKRLKPRDTIPASDKSVKAAVIEDKLYIVLQKVKLGMLRVVTPSDTLQCFDEAISNLVPTSD